MVEVIVAVCRLWWTKVTAKFGCPNLGTEDNPSHFLNSETLAKSPSNLNNLEERCLVHFYKESLPLTSNPMYMYINRTFQLNLSFVVRTLLITIKAFEKLVQTKVYSAICSSHYSSWIWWDQIFESTSFNLKLQHGFIGVKEVGH